MDVITWFKVDDTLAFHGKTVAAGVAAMGLWVRAGAWSAQMLTDGFIPEHLVPGLSDGTPELAERLVSAGFWRKVRDGYLFHEWTDRNPTSDSVKEHRMKEAERKASWRSAKANKAATSVNNSHRPVVVPAGQTSLSLVDNHVSPAVSPTSVPDPCPVGLTGLSALPDPTHISTKRTPPNPPKGGKTRARRKATGVRADPDFQEFWTVYGHKQALPNAEKAWVKALDKPDVTAQLLTDRARAYRERLTAAGKWPDFAALPATWLNQERWLDEHPADSGSPVPDDRDPVDILRALWQAADAAAVARILGVPWADPSPRPSETTPYDKWITEVRREFISERHEAAVSVLQAARESA